MDTMEASNLAAWGTMCVYLAAVCGVAMGLEKNDASMILSSASTLSRGRQRVVVGGGGGGEGEGKKND